MAYTPSTGGGGSSTATAGNPFSNSTPTTDFDVISGGPTQIPANADRGDGEHGRALLPSTTSSATSMLGDLSSMSVTQIVALQDRMIAAGLLPKTGRSGIPDSATRAAYTELLQTTSRMNAAGQQVTPDDVLSQAVQAGGGGTTPKYTTDLHQYTPTDPARIRLTAEAAFQTAIGKKPTKEQLDKFVAHFTGEEMTAQATGFRALDQIASQAVSAAASGAATPSNTANPGVPAKDWDLTQQIAGKYGVDPRLLVAIGQHETGWGTLGDGKNGNVLGVGSYDSGSTYKWAGLENQLTKGAQILAQHGVYTVADVQAGKAKFWATDPQWAQGVVSAYQSLAGDGSSAAAPGEVTMDGKPVGGTVAVRLQAMMAAAPGKISVNSGTRSTAEQTKLYNDYKAGKGNLAAKPGSSKHEKGLAADLSFSSDAVRQWAHANAARFGLSFPIASESWHVEPTGEVSATTAAPVAGLPPISQSVVVNQPDLTAQATEYAQNADPLETQAYGVGQQFENLVSILKGGVI